jgi:predicted ATP-grasp superfamily ATP-dependent carboligase
MSFPVVLKPRDGAGSQDLRLLRAPPDADNWPPDHERWRIEEFRPGLAASVAVLCGPAGHVPLQPCTQKLASDGTFKYRGGTLLLDEKLSQRAKHLAAKTVAVLPESCGYVGIDLVLGNSQDGSDDAVIEINPRLTTSYVGLRAATRDNLAEAMLAVAAGELPTLSWASYTLEFSADGMVTRSVITARR